MLGWESTPPAELMTTLTQPSQNSPRVITYYFETEFTLTQAQLDRMHAIAFTHRIDDGAVFYINGTEVLRDNMPDGPVSAATLASNGAEFTIEGPFEVPTGSLQVGSNRVSVSVHQGSTGSSDFIFGLEVDLLELLPDPGAPSGLRIGELAAAGGADWWMEITNTDSLPIDLADHVIATSGVPLMEYVLPAQTIGAGEHLLIDFRHPRVPPRLGRARVPLRPGQDRCHRRC